VPVPEHAPDQPVNVDDASAAAVSVTVVPKSKLALQVEPQAIPDGLELTAPDPVPCLETLRRYGVMSYQRDVATSHHHVADESGNRPPSETMECVYVSP
jgi:hypothetical protein